MQKKLELFKGLFPSCTNIAILNISFHLDFIKQTLENIAVYNDGKVKYIEFKEEKDAQLKATARVFEHIVLGNILNYCEDKKNILKIMYKALENCGNIIILEKKINNNLYEIYDLLEEVGFQATNNIDLFDDFNLITAKKMHNWDNGL